MTVYESMTKLHVGRFLVRVWRAESGLKDSYEHANRDLYEVAKLLNNKWVENLFVIQPTEVANEYLKLDRINAVEVLDADGNGMVVYPDWP
jgi:hypothetical protein